MLCVVSYNPGFMWKAKGWSSFSSLGCSASNCLLRSLFSSEKSPENGKTEFSCNTVITFCHIAFNFHLLPLCLLLHLILGLFLWKLQNRLCLKNWCRRFGLLVSRISTSTYFSIYCCVSNVDRNFLVLFFLTSFIYTVISWVLSRSTWNLWTGEAVYP